jgi:hypothetical protein
MSSRKSTAKSKTKSATVDQRKLLRKAVEWIVNEGIFADVRLHGNVNWVPKHLVMLAVLTAWSSAGRMTDAFKKAARLSQKLFGVLAIHTFQGMVRALVKYGPELIVRLWCRIHMLMEEVSPEHFRIGKWAPMAADGSRFTTPRTRSNEQAFAAKNFGKGGRARSRRKWKNKKRRSKKLSTPVKPQIWLTLIWHMGLKLPWCWKMGPSTSSERHHFMDLLTTLMFPENTLFCCDAGFIGYELWSTILAMGHHFLIRVGGNVRLLKNLGHFKCGAGIVCLWPDAVARRNQPPIILRLIEVKSDRGSMFLVTDVLNERELSTRQLRQLYPLRWGIELQFRTTKQTFGLGKLRSRNADHALAELEWSLMALTMIQLLAIREQTKIEIPPDQTSVAQAIAAIRHAIDTWNEPVTRAESLTVQLRKSTKDTYRRTKSKSARYKPDYKDKPTAGKPIVMNATAAQKSKYRKLRTAA